MGPLSQMEPYIKCWNSHNLALSKPGPGKYYSKIIIKMFLLNIYEDQSLRDNFTFIIDKRTYIRGQN